MSYDASDILAKSRQKIFARHMTNRLLFTIEANEDGLSFGCASDDVTEGLNLDPADSYTFMRAALVVWLKSACLFPTQTVEILRAFDAAWEETKGNRQRGNR